MRNPTATVYAAIVSIWSTVVMAVYTEISPPFKALLTSMTGQHWSTKSVLSVLIFAAVYVVMRKTSPRPPLTLALALVGSIFAGGAIIFGFYVIHFLT